MCTTIGFKYKQGFVFGRTLEVGVQLDNKLLYVPKGAKIIKTDKEMLETKYNTLGSGFFNIPSFGDGINEHGLVGSSNFFPNYATFNKFIVKEKINTTTSNAFDYLLTNAKDVSEVIGLAKTINLVFELNDEKSAANHFFFMDKKGRMVVLEPELGKLVINDNPYGVLTNAPQFSWHTTNLANYININSNNINNNNFNDKVVTKLGEGTGMLGLPGDFTPPSRFIRAAYFVSNTNKELLRVNAILQGFRILSQFDIPKGAVVDTTAGHNDETLYTVMYDTDQLSYHIKNHSYINLQNYSLKSFKKDKNIKFIDLDKTMTL